MAVSHLDQLSMPLRRESNVIFKMRLVVKVDAAIRWTQLYIKLPASQSILEVQQTDRDSSTAPNQLFTTSSILLYQENHAF